jgi:nicotinamide-nucleotide amidase
MAEALDPAVPSSVDELAKFVLREACDRGLKLATAESCTGGLLASLLTDMPGQSHAFERGFVTYTNEAKHEMLGVAQEILDNDGAVSERAAIAMAEGALASSQADIAEPHQAVGGRTPRPGAGEMDQARRLAGTAFREAGDRRGDVGRAEVRVRALGVALGLMRDQMVAAPNADAA